MGSRRRSTPSLEQPGGVPGRAHFVYQQDRGPRDAPPHQAKPGHQDVSLAEREAWRAWFTEQLRRTNYVQRGPTGRDRYYLTELAEATGIPRLTLYNYIDPERPVLPLTHTASRLADALGLQRLTVWARAHCISQSDFLDLLQLRTLITRSEAEAELTEYAGYPEHVRVRWLQRIEWDVAFTEKLQRELGLSDSDITDLRAQLTPLALEIVRREVAGSAEPVPEPYLGREIREAVPGLRATVSADSPLRTPGPRKRRPPSDAAPDEDQSADEQHRDEQEDDHQDAAPPLRIPNGNKRS